MAEIAWQITVFLAPGPGPTGPRPRKKNFLRHTFLPKWTQKKFRPKRMKGGRVIRPFIYHRVTEWQSDRVTESHHFHSLYGWVKFFYAHFQLSRGEICVANFRPPFRLLLIWGIIYILGYLHVTNFNFSINFLFQPKFKGDQFLWKILPIHCLGPQIAGRLEK